MNGRGGSRLTAGEAGAGAPARTGLYPSSEFVFACSYNNLDNLAHQPTGTPAKHALSMYSLDHETGRLTLMTVTNHCEENQVKIRLRC